MKSIFRAFGNRNKAPKRPLRTPSLQIRENAARHFAATRKSDGTYDVSSVVENFTMTGIKYDIEATENVSDRKAAEDAIENCKQTLIDAHVAFSGETREAVVEKVAALEAKSASRKKKRLFAR